MFGRTRKSEPTPPSKVLAMLMAGKDHPEDDAPRLMLADALEEAGQPQRAEFVRAQIELARLEANDSRRASLQARDKELQQLHEAAWLGPLVKQAQNYVFRRGTLHLDITAGEFFSRAVSGWAAGPS